MVKTSHDLVRVSTIQATVGVYPTINPKLGLVYRLRGDVRWKSEPRPRGPIGNCGMFYANPWHVHGMYMANVQGCSHIMSYHVMSYSCVCFWNDPNLPRPFQAIMPQRPFSQVQPQWPKLLPRLKMIKRHTPPGRLADHPKSGIQNISYDYHKYYPTGWVKITLSKGNQKRCLIPLGSSFWPGRCSGQRIRPLFLLT